MEAPQIRQFHDGRPAPADDLNAMGIAVLELVDEVNELRALVEELKSPAPAPKAAGRPAATK
jgi:hypothetical protein